MTKPSATERNTPLVAMTGRTEVFAIGSNPWQEDEREALHHHQGSEWNLITQGTAQRLVGQTVVHLRAGSLVHVPAAVSHGMIASSAKLRFWVIWQPSCHGLDAGARRLGPEEARLLRQHCELIAHHGNRPAIHEPLLAALEVWLPMAWDGGEAIIATRHPAVTQAIEVMQATHGRIEFEVLANLVGLSRSRLGHAFREHLGISLADFRTRCRLQYYDAIRAEHPHHGLAVLAARAGFTNYMQFYRAHLKVRGMPPSADG